MANLVVVGSGTWGAAFASLLARRGLGPIPLCGRRAAYTRQLARDRQHPRLPLALPPGVAPVPLAEADLTGCQTLFWAVPTPFTRTLACDIADRLDPATAVVSLAKGLEHGSLATVCEILEDVLGRRPLATLSGPSHAEEVVGGQPTGLVAAGDEALVRHLVELLHGDDLRLYRSGDRRGVELAGALKNVVAIAAGIADGLGLGDNLKATLVTRGLAELRRLGRATGCQDATFAGLAGIGDLLTTCYSSHSRNRSLGLAIGRGGRPEALLAAAETVPEGAWTARAAVDLADRHGVDLPLASQVAQVVWHGRPVHDAIRALLARSAKEED